MTVGLPLMKKLLTLLAKSVFILLRLTAAASAIDTAIKKKFGLGMRLWNFEHNKQHQ